MKERKHIIEIASFVDMDFDNEPEEVCKLREAIDNTDWSGFKEFVDRIQRPRRKIRRKIRRKTRRRIVEEKWIFVDNLFTDDLFAKLREEI